MNNRKIKTVIFDLDGTLLNTIDDLTDSVNVICQKFDYPKHSIQEVKGFVGNGIRKLLERAIPDGLENSDYESIYKDFCVYYQNNCRNKTCPYEGIEELLLSLKEYGLSLGIVSNKNHNAVAQLKDTFFKETIKAAIGQSDDTRKKPAPDTLFEAMKILNAGKETTVYVGDSEVDKETADNAGIPCILVSWGFREREELAKLKPWKLADSPKQILQFLSEGI